MFLSRIITAVVAISFSSFTAYADDKCPDGSPKLGSDIDLRATLPPVLNQDGVGWCYAYGVAAQITEWAIRNHIPGIALTNDNYVSAAGSALSYNRPDRARQFARTIAQLDIIKKSEPQVNALEKQLKTLNQQANDRDRFLMSQTPENRKIMNDYQDRKKNRDILKKLNNDSFDNKTKMSDEAADKLYKDYTESEGLFSDSETNKFYALEKLRAHDNQDEGNYQSIQKKKDLIEEALKVYKAADKIQTYKEPEAGNPALLIKHLADEGLCLESQIHSTDNASPVKLGQDWLVKAFVTDYNNYLNHRDQKQLCAVVNDLKYVFPTVNVPDLSKIVSAPINLGDNPIDQVWNLSVKGHLVQLKKKPDVRTLKVNATEIEATLDRSYPVGIIYHPEVLDYGPEPYGEHVGPDLNSTHYSLIVGKKFDCRIKKMMFILRNSWGADDCRTRRASFTKRSSSVKSSIGFNKEISDLNQEFKKCNEDCDKNNSKDPTSRLNCRSGCSNVFLEAKAVLNEAPYTCDAGDYVITESQLLMGTVEANYVQ